MPNIPVIKTGPQKCFAQFSWQFFLPQKTGLDRLYVSIPKIFQWMALDLKHKICTEIKSESVIFQ